MMMIRSNLLGLGRSSSAVPSTRCPQTSLSLSHSHTHTHTHERLFIDPAVLLFRYPLSLSLSFFCCGGLMSPNPGLAVVGILLVCAFPMSILSSGVPLTLSLRRAFPVSGWEQLEAAKTRDMVRHRRILQNVVDFQLQGSANPFAVGLYYTTVKLGFPPKEYHVQIDTGSDILWVSCSQCDSCPTSSGLDIALRLYDPQKSSSSSVLSCSDSICLSAIESGEAKCESQSCSYTFQYGDGSGTTGSYVSDTLTFNTVLMNGITTSSATVTFGCSSTVSGDLTKTDRAVDGILGFGQNRLSIVSQLASQKIAPNAFSHCLKGSDNGGGIFVLGKIEDPEIVYSPLVPSMPHYNLYLESISVQGQAVPISPSAFSSVNSGTIIDSGTTLAYLAEEAYDPFVNSIVSSVGGSVQAFNSKGSQCFATPSSIQDVFPSVSLNFKGASMVLQPQDYLLQQGTLDAGATVWCIGWQKMQGSTTILGDIVLKDKIFVYDLDAQQVGWMKYDCSNAVNVSLTSGKTAFVPDKQADPSGTSPSLVFGNHILCIILASVHYILTFRIFFCPI